MTRTLGFPIDASESADIDAHAMRPKYRALYAFDGRSDDELSFCVGDVITLLSDDAGDGWYFGSCQGRVGVFPANYVEPLEQTSTA